MNISLRKMWVEVTEVSLGFGILYLELQRGLRLPVLTHCPFQHLWLFASFCPSASITGLANPLDSKPSLFFRIWFLVFDLWPSWTITASKKRAYQPPFPYLSSPTLIVLCPVGLITCTCLLLPSPHPGGWASVQKGIRPISHSNFELVICWLIIYLFIHSRNIYWKPTMYQMLC